MIFLKEEIFFAIVCNDMCIFASITQFLRIYTHFNTHVFKMLTNIGKTNFALRDLFPIAF